MPRDENQNDSSILPARIILVEDDQDLREGLAETLRLHGFQVVDVPSGIAFFRALRLSEFDIAILDVNLHDINGFELAQELSHDRKMGIVILTARTGMEDRKRGYDAGADVYMTKPVDGEELLLVVRNLARRVHRTTDANEISTVSAPIAWRIERDTSRLIAPNGAAILLTGREMMLLEELEKASGSRISRTELSVSMGYGRPGPDNRNLDVVLHRLQQKATKNGIALPLQNVQSVGIRFTASLRIV